PSGETFAKVPKPLNVVAYRYDAREGVTYLSDLYDTPPATADSAPLAAWAHHTHLAYETRTDPTFDFRRGWMVSHRLRLTRVEVASKTARDATGARELVRRYRLTYDPAYHASQLASVTMDGRCDTPVTEDPVSGNLPGGFTCPSLPTMTFGYQH